MDKDLAPKISVIFPAYNAEAYIRKASKAFLLRHLQILNFSS
jgi:hypothetical protein